jgi:O-antigen ligase
LKLANREPILGAGYGGFWTRETKEYFKAKPEFTWGPQQAHNGYIETYAQLGLVGVALLAWTLFHAVRDATRRLVGDFEYSRIRLILLLAAAVHNYAEAGFPRPTHLVWFTFLVVAVTPRSRSVTVRAATPSNPTPRAAKEPGVYAGSPRVRTAC